MVEFGKFVHTKNGKYIMSLLLGFGLASLFRTVCMNDKCMQFKSPPLDKIENKIYKHSGKCYTYEHSPITCSAPNTKIIST